MLLNARNKKGDLYGTIDGGCEYKNRIYASAMKIALEILKLQVCI